jgi:hypothetical protein
MSEYKRGFVRGPTIQSTPYLVAFVCQLFDYYTTHTLQHSQWWVIDGLTLSYISLSFSVSQGSIVSAIGSGINAIISAIAGVIETIISAIVMVRVVFI